MGSWVCACTQKQSILCYIHERMSYYTHTQHTCIESTSCSTYKLGGIRQPEEAAESLRKSILVTEMIGAREKEEPGR